MIDFMIDTVKISLNNISQKDFNFSLLKYRGSGFYPSSSDAYLYYEYKNFSITIRGSNLTLLGSLPKFFLGHNITSLPFSDIMNAVYRIEKELGLPLASGKIKRIDVGQTFKVNYPVNVYLSLYLFCPFYRVVEYPGQTKTFFNTSNSMVFYDKKHQFFKEHPDGYGFSRDFDFSEDCNYLRYELQLRRNIQSILGQNEILVYDLSNPQLLSRLISLWYHKYQKIYTQHEVLDFEIKKGFKPLDFKDCLAAQGLISLGEQNVLEMLQRKHKTHELDTNSYYRCRDLITELTNVFSHTPGPLHEMNEKIEKHYQLMLNLINSKQ